MSDISAKLAKYQTKYNLALQHGNHEKAQAYGIKVRQYNSVSQAGGAGKLSTQVQVERDEAIAMLRKATEALNYDDIRNNVRTLEKKAENAHEYYTTATDELKEIFGEYKDLISEAKNSKSHSSTIDITKTGLNELHESLDKFKVFDFDDVLALTIANEYYKIFKSGDLIKAQSELERIRASTPKNPKDLHFTVRSILGQRLGNSISHADLIAVLDKLTGSREFKARDRSDMGPVLTELHGEPGSGHIMVDIIRNKDATTPAEIEHLNRWRNMAYASGINIDALKSLVNAQLGAVDASYKGNLVAKILGDLEIKMANPSSAASAPSSAASAPASAVSVPASSPAVSAQAAPAAAASSSANGRAAKPQLPSSSVLAPTVSSNNKRSSGQ
jgi:hypothetical protein